MIDEETFQIHTEVFVVMPAYHQAMARSPDDYWHLTIKRHMGGVAIEDVREGRCTSWP